jgi:hypothetical protein
VEDSAAVPGPFQPTSSHLRLGLTGAAAIVAGVVIAYAPSFFPQFGDSPLIDSAALIGGVLMGLPGVLAVVFAIIMGVANARRCRGAGAAHFLAWACGC